MAKLKKNTERKLMPGTEDGKYLPFARKGNVLLGVRMQSIKPGSAFGLNETTYFSARLRSAPENGLFAEEDAQQKVVKFQKDPENLWDAWPGVVWEKQSEQRASTTIGVFMPGQFKGGGEQQLQLLLSHVGDGQLAQKLADYLVQLAGADFLICTAEELKAYLDEEFQPVINSILESLKKEKELAEYAKQSVGHFAMQAAILKKVFGEKGAKSPDDEEEQEPEDAI